MTQNLVSTLQKVKHKNLGIESETEINWSWRTLAPLLSVPLSPEDQIINSWKDFYFIANKFSSALMSACNYICQNVSFK